MAMSAPYNNAKRRDARLVQEHMRSACGGSALLMQAQTLKP